MANILQIGERTGKFGTDRPELFSPEFLIVSPATDKLSQDGAEYSDKGTAQSKPRC
jgi:hypothetical protein